MSSLWVERQGVRFLTFSHLDVPHGISSRFTGVSVGAFGSLNLGMMSGDELDKVAENRRLFGAAVGFPTPYSVKLEHGADVVEIVRAEEQPSPPPADGCVTDRPDVPLTVTTADCVSILYHDPVRKAVGAAHAGWKGTLLGVAQNTVQKLQELYGCEPSNLRVALGPCIQVCCFEVDDQVAEQFEQRFPALKGEAFVRPHHDRPGKWHIDLHGALRRSLIAAGVTPDHLVSSPLCTSCRLEDFYSYRRDGGRTGRMAAAICMSR
jgi:YfiH family protein